MSPRQTNFLHVNVKQHVCCKISPSMSVTYKGSLTSLPRHLRKGKSKLFIHTQLISLSTISLAHWIYSSTYHWHYITSRRYQHVHWKPTGKKKRQKEIRCPLSLPKDRLIHSLSKRSWHKRYRHIFYLMTWVPSFNSRWYNRPIRENRDL